MFDASIYTIGWVCAIVPELVAAELQLDEEHDGAEYVQPENDNNAYTFGKIGPHNVVIAALPSGQYGTTSAAEVARDMVRSFTNIKIGLMVGIAGGAPLMQQDDGLERDIRLGDVVVSIPGNRQGGVYQYDFGKAIQDRAFETTGHLNAPPKAILTAITKLQSKIARKGHDILDDIETILSENPRLKKGHGRPSSSSDQLYRSTFVHPSNERTCTSVCAGSGQAIEREERDAHELVTIHYGLIASANTLMKDAIVRDTLARSEDVLCFEMEAAGLMNQLPFLVVRGICDYADSHKNKTWQGYAAMTAAAYAKQLLVNLPISKVEQEHKLSELVQVVNHVKSKLDTVHEHVKTQAQKDAERRMCTWLAAPDPSTNYRAAIELRHPGTGTWLLESETFQRSLQGSERIWLHGLSGCGKTVLATSIIDRLCEPGSLGPLYFYFDQREQTKQTYGGLLRSLMWQMCLDDAQCRQTLSDTIEACQGQQASEKQLADCLRQMFDQRPFVKIVLDALDECEQRPKIYAWIGSLDHVNPGVQLIITSRPEHDIIHMLSPMVPATNNVNIQEAPVDADICAFIEHRLEHDIVGFGRWRAVPVVRGMILESLTSKAQGMFRWATLQLDTLSQCCMRDEVEAQLASLPDNLDETYARILKKIPRGLLPSTKRLLYFLAFAKSSLTLNEIVDALAVSLKNGQGFDPVNRMPEPMELIRLAPSMIVLSRSWRFPRLDDLDDSPQFVVQIAHLSVKEYVLSSSNVETNVVEALEMSLAHSVITRTCLAYLLSVDVLLSRDDIQLAYPFAKFASHAWMYHAKMSSTSDTAVRELILRFCTSEPAFRVAGLYTTDPWLDHDLSTSYNALHADVPLHLMALIDLRGTVVELLRLGIDVNTPGITFDSALCAAASRGNTDLVQLLLANGAHIETHGIEEYKMLRAMREGPPNERRLRLSYNEERSKRLHFRPSAFYWACLNGHARIAEMLLERGADANDSASTCRPKRIRHPTSERENRPSRNYDDFYGTPLAAACFGGHRGVVALLLEHGALVRSDSLSHDERKRRYDGDERFTVLIAAASQGHLSIVKLLLDRQADTNNLPDGCRVSALAAACENGHLEIVKLLLEKGANINFVMGNLSALACACEQDDLNLVEMLLDHGAEVNDDLQKIPAITIGCRSGNLKAVELLIRRGAQVNPVSTLRRHFIERCWPQKPYSSPSQYRSALKLDPWDTAVLLGPRRLPHKEDEMKRVPLQMALQRGNVDIAKLLIRHGAAVPLPFRAAVDLRRLHESADFSFLRGLLFQGIGSLKTLLRHAAGYGQTELLSLLLDMGTSVGISALADAVQWKHIACVHRLLDANAGIDHQVLRQAFRLYDDEGILDLLLSTKDHLRGALLQTVVSSSSSDESTRELVSFLLNVGVRDTGQALEAASACGDLETMQLLLKRDFRINKVTLLAAIYGGTAEALTLALESSKGNVSLDGLLAAAAAHKNADMARILLDAGADINAVSIACRGSRHLQRQRQRRVIVDPRRCEPHYDDYFGTAIQIACHLGDEDTACLLLSRGADLTLPGPLHCASARGHITIMRLLIAGGADVNAVAACCAWPARIEWHCGTPLQAAQAANQVDAIVQLKNNGANPGNCNMYPSWKRREKERILRTDEYDHDKNPRPRRTWAWSDVPCKCKTTESLTFQEERKRKPRRRTLRRRDSFDLRLVYYV